MALGIEGKHIRLEQLLAQRGRIEDAILEVEQSIETLVKEAEALTAKADAIEAEIESLLVVLQ